MFVLGWQERLFQAFHDRCVTRDYYRAFSNERKKCFALFVFEDVNPLAHAIFAFPITPQEEDHREQERAKLFTQKERVCQRVCKKWVHVGPFKRRPAVLDESRTASR